MKKMKKKETRHNTASDKRKDMVGPGGFEPPTSTVSR